MDANEHLNKGWPSHQEIQEILSSFRAAMGDEILDQLHRAGIEPEHMLCFMPIALGCKIVREERGLGVRAVARKLRAHVVEIQGIEAGMLFGIEPDTLARYVAFLGLAGFFNAWAVANPELAARLHARSMIRPDFIWEVPANLAKSLGGSGALMTPSPAKLRSASLARVSATARRPALYQFRVVLKHSQPLIWRRFVVPNDLTLRELHQVLQLVMGWEGHHLHQFTIRGKFYGEPMPNFGPPVYPDKKARLYQLGLRAKSRMTYEYDFGDGWEHQLVLERTLPLPKGESTQPVCIKGERASPPEDAGGIWGYEDKLAALKDPEHPDYGYVVEWMGKDFDPEAFDLDRINEQLRLWNHRRRRKRKSGGNKA